MIFSWNGKTYRFSFKHEVYEGRLGQPPKMSGREPHTYRQHNGRLRELRGETTCYLAELGPKDSNGNPTVTLLAEGVAHCSVSDNYNKEEGRQQALRRALEKLWPVEQVIEIETVTVRRKVTKFKATNPEAFRAAFDAYANRQPPRQRAQVH